MLKDLVVDRSAFDRIIAAGGFVSVNTGQAPEANNIPIRKDVAETAMDAAACIACGACVAACKNASASLFTAAKVSHLGTLPQGHAINAYRHLLGRVEEKQLDQLFDVGSVPQPAAPQPRLPAETATRPPASGTSAG